MTAFRPIYRATLYAPRSVDVSERTVLHPRAGAVHQEAFKVITKSGYFDSVFANASGAATWTSDGVTLSAGGIGELADSDLVGNAWHTDTAVAGAYVQADFGAATNCDRCRIYAASAGLKAEYKVRGSADGLAWTDIQGGFVPNRAGWNEFVFTRSSYRHFRAELTNAPGAGAWVNEIEFADGGANWRPYLSGGPRGRGSEIEPFEKHTDTGERVWRIMDKRTGTSNLQRWLSAYVGDDKGGNQLLGCLWIVEQSLDNGGLWERFATDRVAAVRRSRGSKVWMDLYVRDRADDLDAPIFVGPPHASASAYAHQAQVLPIGLLKPYGDFPVVEPLRATVTLSDAVNKRFVLRVDRNQPNLTRTLFTKGLHELDASLAGKKDGGFNRGRLWVRPIAGAWTEYDYALSLSISDRVRYTTSVAETYGRAKQGTATAPPALSSTVEFYIESMINEASEQLPVLINDVHPVTLLKHICNGYFGKLKGDGSVTWSVPTDSGLPGSTFDALELDDSLPKVRFVITEKAELREWVEENLLPLGIVWALDEYGRVILADMRRKSLVAPVAEITDADLVAGPDSVDWETKKDEAVSAVTLTYYGERHIPDEELPAPFAALERDRDQSRPFGSVIANLPDIATVRIEEAKDYPVKVTDLGARAADVGGEEIELDMPGLRFRLGASSSDSEKLNGAPKQEQLERHVTGIASDLRSPFALGRTFYELVCRRASLNAAVVRVGKTVTLTISAIPDPATNVRGGSRLALCLSRVEDGPAIVFRLLDWGASTIAVAPVIGTPVADAVQPATALDVEVTVNASSERARVDYAITDTSVAVRPVDTSALWRFGLEVGQSQTVELKDLPASGRRVWVRTRSDPAAGEGFKLPSSWAYPAGVGYVDLTVLNPPTGLNLASPNGDAITATWAVGNADALVELFIKAGAVAPTGLESERVCTPLNPGSVKFEIVGETVAATQYTVGVRHTDRIGNVSAMASATIVAGAAAQLTAPLNPDAFSFRDNGRYGMVVMATALPSDIEFEEAVETGVGTDVYGGFAVVKRQGALADEYTMLILVAPNDRLRRKLKARSVRDGATASEYTAEVLVLPWSHDPIVPLPSVSVAATRTPLYSGTTQTGWRLSGTVGEHTRALAIAFGGTAVLSAVTPTGQDSGGVYWADTRVTKGWTLDIQLSAGGLGTVTFTPREYYDPAAGGAIGPSVIVRLERAPVVTHQVRETSATVRNVTLSIAPTTGTIAYRVDGGAWIQPALTDGSAVIRGVDVGTADRVIEYYGVAASGTRSEVYRLVVDKNAQPEITSTSVTEAEPLKAVGVFGFDDDGTHWRLWARRGASPKAANGVPEERYLKYDGGVERTSIDWRVSGAGADPADRWYWVLRLYDDMGNFDEAVGDFLVNGAPPAVGALSNLLAIYSAGFNIVDWSHNQTAQDSAYTVRVRERVNGGAYTELVTGRDVKLEPDGGSLTALYGGYRTAKVGANPSDPGAQYLTFDYEVQLKRSSDGVVVNTYTTSVSGWYAPEGGGSAPVETPDIAPGITFPENPMVPRANWNNTNGVAYLRVRWHTAPAIGGPYTLRETVEFLPPGTTHHDYPYPTEPWVKFTAQYHNGYGNGPESALSAPAQAIDGEFE